MGGGMVREDVRVPIAPKSILCDHGSRHAQKTSPANRSEKQVSQLRFVMDRRGLQTMTREHV